MADLSKVNLNGTEYSFKDSTAIKDIQVVGETLPLLAGNIVNIKNDYLMKTTVIDCTSLDQDTWYPVTYQLKINNFVLINIDSADTLLTRSWSTHANGKLIATHKKYEELGSGWGINNIIRKIYESTCSWVTADPVQKVGQVSQNSLGYVYVRGGGRYTFKLSGNVLPVLHTTDYAVTSGSTTYATLSLLTSVPNIPITVNIASTSNIPTVNNAKLTIQKNGTTVQTFTANQSTDATANITVPTKLSELTDDVVTGKYLPLAGGTMKGNINLGGYSIILRTDTSWTNSDRSIPFGVSGNPANINFYNIDSSKGLTYNPNTGAIKAGAFVKRGGTSAQFLKADGSVDSNTYLTQQTLEVVNHNPVLEYGRSDIKIADINGIAISVNMPDAPAGSGSVSVVNSNPTLAWGTTSQVGTVGGSALQVTMPANPNTDTKVTSAANHYTPTQNSSYSLPTSLSAKDVPVFISQLQRDAKGHVVGSSQSDVTFTRYGIPVTLATTTNTMRNPSTGAPQNVLQFLLAMANYCAANTYKRYCNGFISDVLLSSGTATSTLVFSNGSVMKTINTGTPIYFEFYCDNVVSFVKNSGTGVDAHATMYATTPSPYFFPCIITLDWKSGTQREVWGVYNPSIYCSGQTELTVSSSLDDLQYTMEAVMSKNTESSIGLTTAGQTNIYFDKMTGVTCTRKVKLVSLVNLVVNIIINDTYSIIFDSNLREATITANFNDSGRFIDCSIS